MGPLAKAATSAGITLGLFAAAEGLLAVLGLPDPGLFAGDPAFHWTLAPNLDREVSFPEEGTRFQVRTSPDGYRDDPLPQGGLWIAAMGCSTTFGWGVAEHEAWPALLEQALGIPVLNGGVPGYSTHQALRSMGPVLAAEPALIIYSYLVRDAQLAPKPDSAARPTPWLASTHLVRLVQGLARPAPDPARGPAVAPSGGGPRVAPTDYAANLRLLVERARTLGSEVLVVPFPMVDSPLDHVLALEQVDAPQVAVRLPDSVFFPSDPLHLTPSGHRLLAQALESPIRALMAGEPVDGPLSEDSGAEDPGVP